MIIGIVGYAGDGKTLLSVIYTTHLIYGNPFLRIWKNSCENSILKLRIGQGVDLANSILGSNNEDEFYKALKEMYKTTGETDIRTKTTFPDALVNKIIRLIVWSKEAERFDKLERDYPKITSLVDDIISVSPVVLYISFNAL